MTIPQYGFPIHRHVSLHAILATLRERRIRAAGVCTPSYPPYGPPLHGGGGATVALARYLLEPNGHCCCSQYDSERLYAAVLGYRP